MIDAVLRYLRCPVCAGGFDRAGPLVRCGTGHAFDLARQGYLNLRTGRQRQVTGDTAEMVDARARFLDGGHHAPLAAWLCAAAAGGGGGPRLAVEIGVGTGYYLSRVVDADPDRVGLAVDVSKPALRRAAGAHPRIGAVAFDAAGPWPVRDAAAGVVLDVFAPRNVPEMRRVLRPDGLLLVVTPGPAHLAELRGPLGLVGMDDAKEARLAEQLTGFFVPRSVEALRLTLSLRRDEAADLALMGPTGHHVDRMEVRRRAAVAFGEEVAVTASFTLGRYRPAR
jgi:23S rRNA (guanine745-N1)-methyltransferase